MKTPNLCLVKALIFDMDGVLFSSNDIHRLAYLKTLRPLGVKHIDYRKIAGMKTEQGMKALLHMSKIQSTPSERTSLTQKKRDIAFALLKKRPPVVRGCKTILKALAKRYRLALASSSSRTNTVLFQKASKTSRLFSLTISGNDIREGKPSPAIYRLVLKRMRLRPQEAIVIEDSPQGIQAAVRAAIPVIGMQGDHSRKELLRLLISRP